MIPEVAGDWPRRRGLREALPLGGEHLEQLPAARHQRRQGLRGGIGDGPRRRLHAQAEEREELGIDGIRLRAAADGVGKRADLAGIDDGDGQAGRRARGHQRRLVAPTGFQDDQRRVRRLQPGHHRVEGGRRGRARPALAGRLHGDDELGFADINPDDDRGAEGWSVCITGPILMAVRARGPFNCSGSAMRDERGRPGWPTV